MKNQKNKRKQPFSPTNAGAEGSNTSPTRRAFFKASAVVAGGMAGAAAGLVAQPTEAVSQGAFFAASEVSLEFYPSKEDPIAQTLPINSVLAGVILRADLMTTDPREWAVAVDLLKPGQ